MPQHSVSLDIEPEELAKKIVRYYHQLSNIYPHEDTCLYDNGTDISKKDKEIRKSIINYTEKQYNLLNSS